ncbi:MAG: methyltransferase domain-containing protein [Deltaproteobacteria bacterium]|nr:methyltransferase domain-containing protein [Deltaproteobacteria bacterium]
MKKRILEVLLCPSCLPEEHGLDPRIIKEEKDDILEGVLSCLHCGREYAIQNGIAFLDPGSPQKVPDKVSKYEAAPVVSSYLWSHYGDLLKDENASAAYQAWSEQMGILSGFALDAGSAVGRFTFELSRKSDFAIGIDNSISFIRTARELMLRREKEFELLQEGLVTQKKTVTMPEGWKSQNTEFLVADAQRLPFKSGSFSSLASLNLVDKLPEPLVHLKEMNRVAKPRQSQFLFSDPFSWSDEVTGPGNWLGGTHEGPYSGDGVKNVMEILSGRKNGLGSQWNIERMGHVWWKIRTHQNHYELIRSCFIKANR